MRLEDDETNPPIREAQAPQDISAILLSVYSQAATILKILQVSAGGVTALLLVVLMVSSARAVPTSQRG
jgi:hypothetical protein